jgi:hypothetical protein
MNKSKFMFSRLLIIHSGCLYKNSSKIFEVQAWIIRVMLCLKMVVKNPYLFMNICNTSTKEDSKNYLNKNIGILQRDLAKRKKECLGY